MPTYLDWNDALIRYSLQGLGLGSRVFLSIDDDALESIALSFNEPRPKDGWVEEFKRSVRNRCVYNGEVNLPRFSQPLRDTKKRPRYVPFLASMVLAAHYMGDDSGDIPVDPKDFFTHFNALMGLSVLQGRTKGLNIGEDSRLWEDWGSWLRSQGFLSTAIQGEGAYKYIRYPVSQTILRQSDKNKLWRHFTSAGWRKNYDAILLMQRIRRDSQYLTMHLQEILDSNSDMWLRSYEAISQMCYEVYEEWRESGGIATRQASDTARIRTSLDAKIYRYEDSVSGLVEYRIFPRQTRQAVLAELCILHNGTSENLIEDRPGWYRPLWTLDSEQLSNGLRAKISSINSPLQSLILPARDFWVLTLDPETPESGIYASWDKGIELGSQFVLLAREKLRSDISRLRNEGLLEWTTVSNVFEGWEEYRGVTVQSEPQAWTSLTLENDELRLTLQPRTNFNIIFVGGLRAPRGMGWFIGYGPKVSFASFFPDADISIFSEDEQPIYVDTIEAGKLVELSWNRTGNFRVVINQNGVSDERIVRILDWIDIEHKILDFEQMASETGLAFFGAAVKD